MNNDEEFCDHFDECILNHYVESSYYFCNHLNECDLNHDESTL